MKKEPDILDSKAYWYVLRFLYRNQPKVRALFEANGVKTFSPKKLVVKIEKGRRVKKYEDILWDLFFVHSSKEIIDPYVAKFDNFQYKFKSGGKRHNPLIVPEDQMDAFIKAVEASKNPLFISQDDIDMRKGTRVRIVKGPLSGFEGIVIKVKGAKAKRFIVEIPNTLAVAVEVSPNMIVKI